MCYVLLLKNIGYQNARYHKLYLSAVRLSLKLVWFKNKYLSLQNRPPSSGRVLHCTALQYTQVKGLYKKVYKQSLGSCFLLAKIFKIFLDWQVFITLKTFDILIFFLGRPCKTNTIWDKMCRKNSDQIHV